MKHNSRPIPVLGACILTIGAGILLIVLLLLVTGTSSGFLFFMNRWVSSPDWSPDGDTVAFTCHYPSITQVWADGGKNLFYWGYIPQGTEICIIKTDGHGLARLTNNQVADGHPAWSPDGQLIAYLSGPAMENSVHVIRKDGTPVASFGKSLDGIWQLKWSPDGDKICFAGADPLHPSQGVNLYVAVLESEDVYALTTLPGDELEFDWSPDGSQLAFVRFPRGFHGLSSEGAAIWVTDVKGGGNRVVVDGFAGIGDLIWSPDGGNMAFWAYRITDCVERCAELYVVDLSDNSVQCLTEQYELDVGFEAAWAPDGERIAFVASTPQGRGLYAISLKGDELSKIAPLLGTDNNLVWAPNGKFIAFERGAEGDKTHIWLAHTEKGTLGQLKTP